MSLIVLDRVCDPGGDPGAVNEDILGYGPRAAWVLDGATGLTGKRLLDGPSDAAWLVARYDAFLNGHAEEEPRLDAYGLVYRAIADVAAEFEAKRQRPPRGHHELPSAGMALVCVADGALEYASLGDCRVILDVPGRFILSSRESRLNELDGQVLRAIRRLRRTKLARNHAEARRAVNWRLRCNRGRLNTRDGYWVLSIHPGAADELNPMTIPLRPGGTVTGLIVSDGLYRLVDTFRIYDNDATLLAEARGQGLEALLNRLREIEDRDPDCAEYIRFKQKDDATGLLFTASA